MPQSARNQPQGSLRANPANPYGRRLHWAATPTAFLGNPPLTNRPANISGGPFGLGTNGGSNGQISTAKSAPILGGRQSGQSPDNVNLTIIIVATGVGNSSYIYDGQEVSNAGPIWKDGSGNFSWGDGTSYTITAPWASASKVLIAHSGQYGGAIPAQVWVDGSPVTTTMSTPSDMGHYYNTPPFRGFFGSNPYPGSNTFSGKGYLVAILRGLVTQEDVNRLNANPWQVFEGQARMLYAASAPATVSGGITWTEASDSVAAAGSATVSGTAAWTEASDSAALAGSVGSGVSIAASWTEAADAIAVASTAQVNAAGAWTETADTTAIAASASITAAAAWTEQADTISMAGSAGNGLAANITWTEAADVTTAAGSIRITAAGSWTEAGDSAAIVVNVAAAQSASLSWTEAPDSIAIVASITAAPVVGTIAWTEQADVSAIATYPKFYSFTLMRSDPISSAGAMSSSAPAFTLMRADSIASSSKMSAAPINQNVNLI